MHPLSGVCTQPWQRPPVENKKKTKHVLERTQHSGLERTALRHPDRRKKKINLFAVCKGYFCAKERIFCDMA
jgi:hypothetical protein